MVAVGALLTAERLSELASHGYPVGLAELDDVTRGLLPGALWVVLGTSGVGRTVFACQIAAGASQAGADTALILGRELASLAAANLVCAHARVADHRLRSGSLSAREADRARASAREIAAWPLRVLTPQDPEWEFSNSTSVPRVDHWFAPGAIPTRRIADVLVVDDLDALTARPVPDVLSAMRTWAKTTGQAIVVTLPDAPFVAGGILSSDMRREADIAIRLCRPDLHDVRSARAGEADLDVLGHRQGPTARVVAAFQGHYRRFADLRPPVP